MLYYQNRYWELLLSEIAPLDLERAAQMIEWLDEQRRQDKRNITALEQRLALQDRSLEALQKRINALESDMSLERGERLQGGESQDLISDVAGEVRKMLEQQNKRRLAAEREIEHRSDLAHQALTREFGAQKERIQQLEQQQLHYEPLNEARRRLERQVGNLQRRVEEQGKLLEEPEQRFRYLEEQIRRDERRINELETELPELRKLLDINRPKIDLLEDLTLRNERSIQEIHQTESERREQALQFIDQQARESQQLEQQQAEMTQRFQEQESVMQERLAQFASWAETHHQMKQIIQEYTEIIQRIERNIREFAETQRLSEERLRSEWEGWGQTEQQRWKQFMLSNDEIWRGHDREFERFVQRVQALEERFPPLQENLANLWQLERNRARLYREGYQRLLAEHDQEQPPPPTDSGR